jgi:hypothetical protein
MSPRRGTCRVRPRASARREDGRALQTVTLALAVVALLVIVAVVIGGLRRPVPPPASEPVPAGEPGLPPLPAGEPDAAPAAQARPTAAAAPRSGSSTYVVTWESEGKPAPTPWRPEPTPTRWPTPSPRPCVEYTWQWGDSPAVIGQLLVEIRARNRCGRKLEALEVMFRAEGRKGGDLIYSGQGNLLEPIYPDSVRTVMIVLPGSRTYFDDIEVVPINPPTR